MTNVFQNRFTLHTEDTDEQRAKIKVIGVGGGGSNAVDHMVSQQIEGVDFYIANTDVQALSLAKNIQKIQFGAELTKGLGAGANPEIGRAAALADKDKLVEDLKDADMIFVTAGMGGGTGTGAAPVISAAVKEVNPDVLVVAVVTTPFGFEGQRRMECAQDGLRELKSAVDSLITIPNEKVLAEGGQVLKEAYGKANDVLKNAVQGIADLVVRPGFMNLDFADIRTVMSKAGTAVMGTGRASGENRAINAARKAIDNPLLADVDVSNANGLLVNITASSDMTTQELKEIGNVIKSVTSESAEIITGQVYDDEIGDEIRVTIIATGLGDTEEEDQPEERSDELHSTGNGRTEIFPETDYNIDPARNEDGEGLPAVLRNRTNGGFQPHYDFGNGNGNGLGSKPRTVG